MHSSSGAWRVPVIAFAIIVLAASARPMAARPPKRPPNPRAIDASTRDDLLRRAQLTVEPAVPIEQMRLDVNPDETFSPTDDVSCRYSPQPMSGSTPKFTCALPSGRKIKIKYGRGNPEVYAEVAATRLLSALGFPTDRMYVVHRVTCFGCPDDPFAAFKCFRKGGTPETCAQDIDYAARTDFEDVVIEVALEGRRIETAKISGWRWRELSMIDPARGGATLAEADALRLMAVFLGHWDNKPANQRLICLDGGKARASLAGAGAGACERPLAMIHDLGATFGPSKLNLRGWASTPIWTDTATCAVSMRTLPYEGVSFPNLTISEQGRTWLASRLGRLSVDQIRQLFEGARFARHPHLDDPEGRDVEAWVRAFEDKRRVIIERPPCLPSSPNPDGA